MVLEPDIIYINFKKINDLFKRKSRENFEKGKTKFIKFEALHVSGNLRQR